jgi:hypothetical protein
MIYRGEVLVRNQPTKTWKASFCILVSLVVAPCLVAQQDHDAPTVNLKYSQASICGSYGAVATYGANIARALGTESFDGNGHLTGSAIVNQPATATTRTISNIGLSGTYSVNHDGTGQMLLTVTLPDGSTPTVTEDFVITKSRMIHGVEIATEIEDAQEVPSAVVDDSSLVIHSYTLRSVPKSCTRQK